MAVLLLANAGRQEGQGGWVFIALGSKVYVFPVLGM